MIKKTLFLNILLFGILITPIIAQNQNCNFLKNPFLTDFNILNRESVDKLPSMSFFSASKTENIYINLTPGNSQKIHIISLIFYDPYGNVYYRGKYPVTGSEVNANGSIQIPGYRFPQKIKGGKIIRIGGSGKKRIIPIPFAVAGTYITNNHLFGEWHVEIYVDNSKEPCYNLSFTIGE